MAVPGDSQAAFLFDLDGTLVDTVYGHILAWQKALAEAGMAVDGWRIHRKIGMSGGLFARAGVEIAVLEVGLGGRLDSTTVGRPELEILARIDYDHQAWLGHKRYMYRLLETLGEDVTENLREQERLSAITRAAASVADSGSLSATLEAMAREVWMTANISAVQIMTLDNPHDELRVVGMAGFGDTAGFTDRLSECRRLGADAVIVSNHGGRHLDNTLATVEVLPEAVAAARGRLEIYLDGGIRRGADVVKAIALGAKAVFIGRPLFWGLAVGGEQGVVRVLDILREEIEITMAKCGRPTIASIDATTIVKAPAL